METATIFVVGLGASTAVGRDAWSSAAAVRAGVAGFTDHPYAVDAISEPVRAAIAPWVDIVVTGAERHAALLFPAIDEALSALGALDGLRVAFALGLPAPRAGLSPLLEAELTAAVRARFGGVFRATASFPTGHAAGLMALDAAMKGITAGRFDACVVAAVDSYLEDETLTWLEACDQLHRAGPLNNAWGFTPGEAAGAVLLANDRVLQQRACKPLAQVRAVGFGVESNRIKTETVCIGQGLTQAFRGALRFLPAGRTISDIYCDMNGEPYRADEYAFACLRTKESLDAASDFVAPADCWGDVGAAGSVLHLQLAAISGVKGYARGGSALIWASSETGERAAGLVEVGSHAV
jgi:3-oxoacyl-[acyl-carrier-protein] synthase I